MFELPRLARRLSVAAALFLAPAFVHGAAAAPVEAADPASANVNIVHPAVYRNLEELNFATLAVTTGGTAIIDPNTDLMTTTGAVTHITGTPYAALFEAVSPSKSVVIIRIPKDPITLTRVGGTETMTVSNWTMSGQAKRTVAVNEPFQFKVGGTLFLNANQVDGTYLGTFEVDIQYP